MTQKACSHCGYTHMKGNCPAAIRRLQGESFALFAARQRETQRPKKTKVRRCRLTKS